MGSPVCHRHPARRAQLPPLCHHAFRGLRHVRSELRTKPHRIRRASLARLWAALSGSVCDPHCVIPISRSAAGNAGPQTRCMIRSILVLLSFHSYGSLEHDPEGEMKNLPRSLLKYLRRFHPPWPVTAFSLESLRMSVEGLTVATDCRSQPHCRLSLLGLASACLSADSMLEHRTRRLRAGVGNGLTNGGDDLFHHLPVLHAQIAGEGLLDRNPNVIR